MSAEIKYIVKPHPVTGVTNGKLGIWLFLASEVMLFGALFSTYILLRVGASSWPRGADLLNIPLATLNTVILITSSVTMVLAYAAVQMNNIAKFRRYLGLTILLSFAFLVVKGFEYAPKFKHYEVWLTQDYAAGLDGEHVTLSSETSILGHLEENDSEADHIVFAPDAVDGAHAEPMRIPRDG
ncbi:MAG: cytochrome c oxidase subunit 3, partial [Planctomycetes bacterium]|nr:cytochrome c oxidase subunit 3 [Planctomycetota bacterium]